MTESLFALETTTAVLCVTGIKSSAALEQRHLRGEVIRLDHFHSPLVVSETDVFRSSIRTCTT